MRELTGITLMIFLLLGKIINFLTTAQIEPWLFILQFTFFEHHYGGGFDLQQKSPFFTLLLIRMLERKACFSDEDRRFKVVCPFLLLGFKRLFHRVGFVGQSGSE